MHKFAGYKSLLSHLQLRPELITSQTRFVGTIGTSLLQVCALLLKTYLKLSTDLGYSKTFHETCEAYYQK